MAELGNAGDTVYPGQTVNKQDFPWCPMKMTYKESGEVDTLKETQIHNSHLFPKLFFPENYFTEDIDCWL